MKARATFMWGSHYDWIIIPTLMIGFRGYGIGIAILFLKLKVEFILAWGIDKYLREGGDYDP